MRIAVLALLSGLLAGPTANAPKPVTVKIAIESMKFVPAKISAKPGDTIVWTNNDIVAHTATAGNGAFDSKVIPPGATFKFVARRAGDFAYVCTLHQPMTGQLVVR
jgi:plastocyanin